MNRLPEISSNRMSIKERLSLRRELDVTANEMELLELVSQCGGMSLQKMADELGMVKSGVDKIVLRLIEKGLLTKTAGKPTLSERSQIVLQSGTKTQFVPQSSTNDNGENGAALPIVLQSGTTAENVVKSSTISPDAPHALTHGGNSILLIKIFETLKEEKNKEEKINPPNPLDKKEENKKEERRVGRQNRAAQVMICGLMLHKAQKRIGKRLKRLPKLKKLKIVNIPFDVWWEAYQKKVDRSPKLEKKWEKLTDAERIRAMEHTARYVKSQPDKKYRKNPETYLSNKSFNNEIIEDNGKSNGNRKTGYGIGSVPSTVEKADTLVIRVDELGDIEF